MRPLETPDRVAALRRFGYTLREAEFLEIAMTHSGHFLRRQFNAFLGQPDGGAADRFLRRANERGHLRSRRIAKRTMLHHVASYQLYRAVADPDCRHRRERALWAVRKKVMALDYVLAHRGERFLATGAQKLAFFSSELSLSPSCLPSKAYRVGGPDRLARRYFVDRFPIHVAGDDAGRFPVVSFCYVDDGLSLSGFKTYLDRYQALLAVLGRFRIVVASPGEYRRSRAERVASAFGSALKQRRAEILADLESKRRGYFRVRDAFERKDYRGITKADLDRFRRLRNELESAEIDADYEHWKRNGRDSTTRVGRGCAPTESPFDPTFSFSLLDHDYQQFFGV